MDVKLYQFSALEIHIKRGARTIGAILNQNGKQLLRGVVDNNYTKPIEVHNYLHNHEMLIAFALILIGDDE